MTIVAVESPAPPMRGTVSQVPGVVQVRKRVIDKVVREASAAAIGVSRDDVHIEVTEWGGGLTVHVSAKLPVPDLADTEAIRSQTQILDRIRFLQSALVEDIARLTGQEIQRVSFTVTGAIISERKRVR